MNNRMYNDIWLYRIVVAVPGLSVMVSAVGAIVLTLSGESTPEAIVAMDSTASVGVVGLLVPSNR